MPLQNAQLWTFFQGQACQQEILQKQIQTLTEQINNCNRVTHQLHHENSEMHLALNNANQRVEEIETLYSESERTCVGFRKQLKEEQQQHRLTKDSLHHEFACHAKTETTLERYWKTVNKLSEFLTVIQVSSIEDKERMVKALSVSTDVGTLLLELEEKKQIIKDMEDQRRSEKERQLGYLGFIDEKSKNIKLAELQGDERLEETDKETDSNPVSSKLKKQRVNRRAFILPKRF